MQLIALKNIYSNDNTNVIINDKEYKYEKTFNGFTSSIICN